ncbi:hypothetical protein HK102_013243, partial [Quaeritorhiza haematococci]
MSHNHSHSGHGHSHHSSPHSPHHSHDHIPPPHEQQGGEEEYTVEREEYAHFSKVIRAFRHYRLHSLALNAKRRRDYNSIPPTHRRLIDSIRDHDESVGQGGSGSGAPAGGGGEACGYERKLDAVDQRIMRNALFLAEIVEGQDGFPVAEPPAGEKSDTEEPPVTEQDMDKVRSTIRQFVRDWSEEGRWERDRTYGPICEVLERRFGRLSVADRGAIKVLVPGAGLGRLTYEIAKRGFSCQGNEFSFYMLLGSNYILNR